MQLAPIVALEMLGMKNTDGDRSRDFYVNTIRQIERLIEIDIEIRFTDYSCLAVVVTLPQISTVILAGGYAVHTDGANGIELTEIG